MNNEINQLLKDLEKTRQTFWNITPEVGEFLANLIIEHNFQTVLEIGTSNGYSALHLARALTKTGGHLYTIESNLKKRFPLAQETFAKSGLTNITLILGHAPEAIPKTPEKFDLAFFDATKKEHLKYFQTLENRINKGGYIITDNIHSHPEALAPFIETIKKTPNWQTTELPLGTGLLLAKFLPHF